MRILTLAGLRGCLARVKIERMRLLLALAELAGCRGVFKSYSIRNNIQWVLFIIYIFFISN